MARYVRTAKSGSEWSSSDLISYNISVVLTAPEQFLRFGVDPAIDHLVDPDIFTTPSSVGADNPSISNGALKYLQYLSLAIKGRQESFIVDFARETLSLLGFDAERNTIIATRYEIPLTICGDANRKAQTGMCLIHQPTMVLLVLVEDKLPLSAKDSQSQVIADAIAAFQFNNSKRESVGLASLDKMTIPCITMSGTRPTFYIVPRHEGVKYCCHDGRIP